jgi:ankyrin repeat protein
LFLVLLLIFIPIIAYRENIILDFKQSNNNNDNKKVLSREAYNSYKLNTPLFEAVKSNDIDLVRSLLEGDRKKNDNNNSDKSPYNVNAEDPKGITPLIEATLLGNVDLVNLLLSHMDQMQNRLKDVDTRPSELHGEGEHL